MAEQTLRELLKATLDAPVTGVNGAAAKEVSAAGFTEEELNTPATIGQVLQAHKDLAGRLRQLKQISEQISVTTSDGGRTLCFSFGGRVHEVKTALVLDVGVWKEGTTYVPGDGVTLGGSFFIAQVDTTEKPGTSNDWRLAVKRGSDGRDYGASNDWRRRAADA
jgi:hypothetical protein